MSDLNEQLRAEFEAWAMPRYGSIAMRKTDGGDYPGIHASETWCAWQEAARRTPAAAPAPVAADLHDEIMRIKCDVNNCTLSGAAAEMSYKQGHRDARHAAAELAGNAETAAPVAWAKLTADGLCRIWFSDKASADEWAKAHGIEALTPLYMAPAAPAPVAAIKTWQERLAESTEWPASSSWVRAAFMEREITDLRAALAAVPAAAPVVQPMGGPRWQVAAAHARGDLPKGVDLAAEEVRAAISGITGPGFVLRLADLDIASIIYAAIASSAGEVKP